MGWAHFIASGRGDEKPSYATGRSRSFPVSVRPTKCRNVTTGSCIYSRLGGSVVSRLAAFRQVAEHALHALSDAVSQALRTHAPQPRSYCIVEEKDCNRSCPSVHSVSWTHRPFNLIFVHMRHNRSSPGTKSQRQLINSNFIQREFVLLVLFWPSRIFHGSANEWKSATVAWRSVVTDTRTSQYDQNT